jgi:nitroreductase
LTYITFIGILFKLFVDLALEKFCKEFNPFSEVRACIMFKDPEGVFKGIIGTYEKVKGAPAYIAFIGDMTSPFVHEKLGYTGEAIILEAISLELSTYWVGGFFRPEVVAEVIKLHNTEGVLAVVLVGYADKKIYSGRKDTGRISQWS